MSFRCGKGRIPAVTPSPEIVSLAVLISGTGRTLRNLIDCTRDGSLSASIVVVLSSVRDAAGLAHAREAGIPALTIPRREHPDSASFSRALSDTLEPYSVDLVLLAGFLHLWEFPSRYERRVLNIHPALLPDFGGNGMYGHRVHEAVLASGARESGCTVHYADHRYDHGPILLQRRVPVLAGETPDSLADRVFREECIAYPEAVRLAVRDLRSRPSVRR